jgi:aspartyl aminopeptidase
VISTRTILAALALSATAGIADEPLAPSPKGPKSSWLLLSAEQRKQVEAFAEGYKAYLRVAKSARLSNAELLRQARAAGFVDFSPSVSVKPGTKLIFNDRDRAAVLVVMGAEPLEAGSRVIATHQDSPHINLKGRPVFAAPGSLALFKTVYYGGIKKYQWSNLPLALVGRIDTTDGRHVDVSLGFAPTDPLFVIPDGAPHSDKLERNRLYADVLAGEELDPVAGSIPGEKTSVAEEVSAAVRARFGVKDEDLVAAELELVPAMQPSDVGLDRGLVGAWGQDDKLSSYCAARAVLDLPGTPAFTSMVYLTNFEEVGSVNNTGAGSEFLFEAYTELLARKPGANESVSLVSLQRALRRAAVVSADTNDGINPLFPQNTEASNSASVGYGVTVKRYGAGFDANSEFTARVLALLNANGIPWQTHTPKVEVGGGGTIGGFFSARDMEVIDIGVPLLSMHAPYEMSSKVDVWNLYRFLRAFPSLK